MTLPFCLESVNYFKLSLLRWNYYILSLINKRGTSVPLFYSSTPCWLSLARIFHELLSRDHEGGLATGQPQGVGSEAYLNATSQGPTPEDARKDCQIRGRSK